MSFVVIFIQALSFISVALIVQSLWAYFSSPIKNVPGPFLAKFTNLWRLLDTWGGRTELTHQLLHEKYGKAVRIGPDLVSLSDPELIRKVYDTRGTFVKTQLYAVNDSKVGSNLIRNVFSTRDEADHTRRRSILAPFYKMSNLLQSEPLVDDVINSFFSKLDDKFVTVGNPCKMDDWLLFLAWDVVGQLTFGRPMGFMEHGKDHHGGLLSIAEKALDYFAVVCQIPQLDSWLGKNPIIRIGPPTFANAAGICAQQSTMRQQAASARSDKARKKDMLDDFLEFKKKNPTRMDDMGVVSALLVNMLAGSDTTASLLRSIVYHVLKNPQIHRKLQQELEEAKVQIPVPYSEASKLPYLSAVIRESSRINPGVAMMLERIVPEGGLELSDGTVLPPGVKVGMNAWVVHRDKIIYGQDADSFRPERWLREDGEVEEVYEERLANMKRHDLTYGAGKRGCLGKYVAILETYKLVASLFFKYDMSFMDSKREWKVHNSWFLRQTGIDINLRHRTRRKSWD